MCTFFEKSRILKFQTDLFPHIQKGPQASLQNAMHLGDGYPVIHDRHAGIYGQRYPVFHLLIINRANGKLYISTVRP